jgi:pimeloyl-ACP methyl ester carboxylesterase
MKKRLRPKVFTLKILRMALPVVLVLALIAIGVFGTLVYWITHPSPAVELVTPASYLMTAEDVSLVAPDGFRLQGFFIAGRKGAPAVVLAPGYGMSRSAALSLSAALRDRGFHSLVYEQRGSGAAPRGSSSLGLSETQDMLAALDHLRSRPEVDQRRSGIWGMDIGARAGLTAAAVREHVKVIAVDSAFDSVEDFLNITVDEITGFSSRIIEFGCRQGFLLSKLTLPSSLRERLPVSALADRKILFIAGENRAALAKLTRTLYEGFQPRQQFVTLAAARARLMSSAELAVYDREVSNFFSQNLFPPAGRSERSRGLAGDRPVENGEFQNHTSGGKGRVAGRFEPEF